MSPRTILGASTLSITVVACGPSSPSSSEPPRVPVDRATACTQEAKVCPDGSAVVRSGPRCEFAPCPQGSGSASPKPEDGVMCAQDVKECPDGSTVSRKAPTCAFAPCPGAN